MRTLTVNTVACLALFGSAPAFAQTCPPGGCPPQYGRPQAPQKPPPPNPSHVAPAPRPDGLPSCADNIVRIDGSQAGGSGVIVGRSGGAIVIVTCKHVLEGNSNFRATTAWGSSFACSVKGVDPRHDLGVLLGQSSLDQVPYALTADTSPAAGQPVIKIGCPGHANAAHDVQNGTVLGFESDLIVCGCPFRPGDSGCGLFDRNGYLVGVVCSYNDIDPSKGYAVCLPAIRALLGRLGLESSGGGQSGPQQQVLPPSSGWQAAPQQKPPGIVPNTPQTTPQQPGPSVIGGILDRIAAHDQLLQELKNRPLIPGPTGPQGPIGPQGLQGLIADATPLFEPLRAKVGQLNDDLGRLAQGVQPLGALPGKLGALEQDLSQLRQGVVPLTALPGKLGDVAAQVDQVGGILSKLAPLASWAGWLPVIATLAGGGGLTGIVLAGKGIATLLAQRAAAKAAAKAAANAPMQALPQILAGILAAITNQQSGGAATAGAAATSATSNSAAALATNRGVDTPRTPASNSTPAAAPTPPASPALPITNQQFIQVPVADPRYDAIMQAVQKVTQKFPDTLGAWKQIESVAQQIASSAQQAA